MFDNRFRFREPLLTLESMFLITMVVVLLLVVKIFKEQRGTLAAFGIKDVTLLTAEFNSRLYVVLEKLLLEVETMLVFLLQCSLYECLN